MSAEEIAHSILERRREAHRSHIQEAERLATVFAAAGALKVILFGSVAHSTDDIRSDIDLVVVTPSARGRSRADRLSEELDAASTGAATDILVYSPEEWEALSSTRRFVLDEIKEKGKILYER